MLVVPRRAVLAVPRRAVLAVPSKTFGLCLKENQQGDPQAAPPPVPEARCVGGPLKNFRLVPEKKQKSKGRPDTG